MREADYIINDLSCSLLHEIPADESYELLVFVYGLYFFFLPYFLSFVSFFFLKIFLFSRR